MRNRRSVLCPFEGTRIGKPYVLGVREPFAGYVTSRGGCRVARRSVECSQVPCCGRVANLAPRSPRQLRCPLTIDVGGRNGVLHLQDHEAQCRRVCIKCPARGLLWPGSGEAPIGHRTTRRRELGRSSLINVRPRACQFAFGRAVGVRHGGRPPRWGCIRGSGPVTAPTPIV